MLANPAQARAVKCPRCSYDQRGTMATWNASATLPMHGTCAECGLEFEWRALLIRAGLGHANPPQTAACPRCGYDQRAALTKWTDQCPLQGTCTECGLEFEWREVLNPTAALPRWSVERERPLMHFPWQAMTTFGRLLLPLAFWKRIRMIHGLDWRRLAGFVLLLVAALVFSVHLTTASLTYRAWRNDVNVQIAQRAGPPMVVVMPQQFAAPTPAPAAAPAAPAVTSTTTGLSVFLRSLINPYSSQSPGNYTVPGGLRGGGFTRGLTIPAAPPLTIAHSAPRQWLKDWTEYIVAPALILLAMPLCTAIAFAALPISRKRAKVRWAHIVRITCYSLAIVLGLAILFASDQGFWWLHPIPLGLWRMLIGVALVALLPFQFVFWTAASSRYLRMDHPAAVGASVVVIGSLAPITFTGVLYLFFDIRI